MNLRLCLVVAAVVAAASCSREPASRVESTATAGGTSRAAADPAPTRPQRSLDGTPLARRFGRAPDQGALTVYPTQRVVRADGAYTWHRADISEAHALSAIGNVLTVTTPGGEQLRFEYDRHVEHENGDWTWVGTLGRNALQEAVITFGDQSAYGSISQPGREALRLMMSDGVSWLVQTDPRQVALLRNVGTRPTAPDFLIAPDDVSGLARRVSAASASTTQTVASPAGAQASNSTAKASVTIDLLLGYTPGFVDYHGGESAAQTRLNNMVEITNESLANSQVDARIRLVKTMSVNYRDDTANNAALQGLTGVKQVTCSSGSGTCYQSDQGSIDPAFNALRSAREQFGADLVSLVRRFQTPENDGCGIAWLNGSGKRGSIAASSEYFGYSVVSDGRDAGTDGKNYICRDETLAHELGHNLGSAHDRDTADGDDNVLQNSEYGVFEYSFGYKTDASSGNFFTVMAYGDSGQTRYRVFSNPRVSLCGNLPCGVDGQADNARSLSQTVATVSGFRAATAPPPPTPPGPTPGAPPAPYDVNADGKSDIFLQGVGTAMAYWAMDGTVRTFDSYLGHGGTGWYRVAYGNFDNAGGADVLWSNGSQLKIWFNNGRGSYVVYAIGSYGNGWQPFAASDVNGDGKSDILFRGGSAVAFWLMDGEKRIGDSYAGDGGSGFRAMTAGDFNADGKEDIVWQSASQLKIWINGGSAGYTPYIVGSYFNGWEPFASGDVNGDRKPDLIFRGGTALAYWQLNGATFVSSHYLGDGGAGYRAFAIADYNGDGVTDVGWENGSSIKLWMNNGVGSYTPTIIGNFICCWKPDGGY